jgi:hypothetical protein
VLLAFQSFSVGRSVDLVVDPWNISPSEVGGGGVVASGGDLMGSAEVAVRWLFDRWGKSSGNPLSCSSASLLLFSLFLPLWLRLIELVVVFMVMVVVESAESWLKPEVVNSELLLRSGVRS